MSFIDRIKQQKRTMISEHTRPDNVKGLTQVLTTLAPLSALWFVAVKSVGISYWLPAGVTVLMSLFLIRVLVLLHECGHGSLFRTAQLNQTFGFLFGVVSGMPQYVWSQHHDYHHSTNGNWEKYRGPLSVLTVDEYEALTARQQRRYQYAAHYLDGSLCGIRVSDFQPAFYLAKRQCQPCWSHS